jgi:hypothetical protein
VHRLRRQVWSGRPPSRQAQILPQVNNFVAKLQRDRDRMKAWLALPRPTYVGRGGLETRTYLSLEMEWKSCRPGAAKNGERLAPTVGNKSCASPIFHRKATGRLG